MFVFTKACQQCTHKRLLILRNGPTSKGSVLSSVGPHSQTLPAALGLVRLGLTCLGLVGLLRLARFRLVRLLGILTMAALRTVAAETSNA